MKRVVAILMVLLMGCTFITPAFAEEETKKASPLVQNLAESNADDDLKLLVTRSNYGYMQFVTNFRTSAMSQYLIQMIDGLIDTGYEPDEMKYIEVLSNIILTFDYNNAADISEQAKLDDLKDFRDYAMDAKDAAVDIIGLLPESNKLGDAIAVAVDGVSVLSDNVDSWIDALYDLDTVLQDYSSYTLFLETVEQNSDGNLQSAAQKMQKALSNVLQTKLEAYSDVSKENVDKFNEFFISDLFADALKNTELYKSDEAVKCLTDQADKLIDVVGALKDSWDLGVLIGKTVGNVVVGGENLIKRVLEMEALFDISCALQTKLPNLMSEALSESDDSKVEQMVYLAQMLIDCRIRGEYCNYSVVASDAGLLSWANKGSAQEAEAWYESQSTALVAMEQRFVALLDVKLNIVDLADFLESFEEMTTVLQNMVVPDGEFSTDCETYLVSGDQLNTSIAKRFGVSCVGFLDFINPQYSLYGVVIGDTIDEASGKLEMQGYSFTAVDNLGRWNFVQNDETILLYVLDNAVVEISYYNDAGYDAETYYMQNRADEVTSGYKAILAQHPESIQHTYGEGKTYSCTTEYTLYDIDKDGFPELIIREDSSEYYIYSYDGNNSTFCGKFHWSYSDCLYEYAENGLIVHDGGMGSLHLEYIDLYTLIDNSLESDATIKSTEECSYEELANCLDSYSPIDDFHPITDYEYLLD